MRKTMSVTAKKRQRDEINKLMTDFLAQGNKIQIVDICEQFGVVKKRIDDLEKLKKVDPEKAQALEVKLRTIRGIYGA